MQLYYFENTFVLRMTVNNHFNVIVVVVVVFVCCCFCLLLCFLLLLLFWLTTVDCKYKHSYFNVVWLMTASSPVHCK